MAMPANRSCIMPPWLWRWLIRKITVHTNRLPATAKIICSYSTRTTGKEKGITMATPTSSAEPLLTPSRPGSAIGLRKSPCIMTPAVASAPPTSTASSTRGRRIFSQMSRYSSLKSELKLIFSAPWLAPNSTSAASNSERPVSMLTEVSGSLRTRISIMILRRGIPRRKGIRRVSGQAQPGCRFDG